MPFNGQSTQNGSETRGRLRLLKVKDIKEALMNCSCYRAMVTRLLVFALVWQVGFVWTMGLLVRRNGLCNASEITEEVQNTLVFYVAPTGNDAWPGKLPEPNSSKTDGPFATLQRARDAIRELKHRQGGTPNRPVTVFIRGGTYFLREPILFTPEDSGTEECPITYAAYQNETPVFSGGRKITGWKQATLNGKPLWVAEISDVREGKWYFRQVWVNGKRARRARYPNKGYLAIAEIPDVTPPTQREQGQTSFRFHENDLKAWETATDVEAVVMSLWVESRLPITSVDKKQRTVTFDKPDHGGGLIFNTSFRIMPGDLYYLEHAFEFLDEAGEWYLDRKAGRLYYLPTPDDDISETAVIAPVLAQLLRLEGKPKRDQSVAHMVFRGLTFSHAEWSLPPGRCGFEFGAVGVPGAIYGEGIRQCAFEDCTFSHLGTYAIEFACGCKRNRIAGCEIFNVGAGAVKIGETVIREDEAEQTHDNEIVNCHIYGGGLTFHSAIGVRIEKSCNNRIAHNHIHDFYYTGISIIGGLPPSGVRVPTRGNIVEFNHIHHIGAKSGGDGPILNDMGGIYTVGRQAGTILRSNLLHDIAGFSYGGWGIYFDGGSTQIVAEKNLVYRTTHGGFHQNWGGENVVRNNIFAFGRDVQIRTSAGGLPSGVPRPDKHLRLTFEQNIVYWHKGNLSAPHAGSWLVYPTTGEGRFNVVFDRNLYWREVGGEIRFDNMSFDEWRAKGMDKKSMIADPLFVAPERDDFRLKPDSPAVRLGFVPFDLSEVKDRKPNSCEQN